MNLLALVFAVYLAGISPTQDQFPPPMQSFSDLGLLPVEARSWPVQVQTRKGVASILELTGLVGPQDGVTSVARDEETLRKILKHRGSVEHWLHSLPGGFHRRLGPEGQALQKELDRAWDVIPKLLAARSATFFLDIPENHKWYEISANLSRHGLMSSPNAGRGQHLNRLYFAVATREACVRLPKATHALVNAGGEAALTGLKSLIDEFQMELKILGCDLAQMRLDIDLARRAGRRDLAATGWECFRYKISIM